MAAKIEWPSDPLSLEWDARKANLKNESRRMIRLTCLSSNGQCIGDIRVKYGTHFALVYESELANIQKGLPTETERADWQAAQRAYDRDMEGAVEAKGGVPGTPEYATIAAEVAKVNGNTIGREYNLLANGRGEAGASGASKARRRPYPAIDDLHVWDGKVPAPRTPEGVAEAAADRMTGSFTAALEKLAGILGGNQKKTA